jgi:hypothetical protein
MAPVPRSRPLLGLTMTERRWKGKGSWSWVKMHRSRWGSILKYGYPTYWRSCSASDTTLWASWTFLVSQHPAANQALWRLPSKYSMPARMWRHGIQSFLELLRHALELYEHMLTFIYLAYSMMTLLLETVPSFKDTWIECLGDLSRCRMAIEDHDLKDREIWTHISRHWYSCASENAPSTGRLHHHLTILARLNALQQLYYYTKSLCVPIPFASAKESIVTLFDPLLESNTSRLSQVDACFVRAREPYLKNGLWCIKSKDRRDA